MVGREQDFLKHIKQYSIFKLFQYLKGTLPPSQQPLHLDFQEPHNHPCQVGYRSKFARPEDLQLQARDHIMLAIHHEKICTPTQTLPNTHKNSIL